MSRQLFNGLAEMLCVAPSSEPELAHLVRTDLAILSPQFLAGIAGNCVPNLGRCHHV